MCTCGTQTENCFVDFLAEKMQMPMSLLPAVPVLWSPIMTCRFLSKISDLFSISGWGHMPCQLSRVDLAGLLCLGICADAPSAPPGPLQRVGDERHCLFYCPHFGDLRSEHAQLFDEAHGAMRSLMWHKNQKSVCAMILAIVNEAQT